MPFFFLGSGFLGFFGSFVMTADLSTSLPAVDFTTSIIDSKTFAGTEYKHEWLVKGVLVKGQPCVVGGPKKACKTTLMIDMAIAMYKAKPFLGHFDVPNSLRVLALSAESGLATLQETAARICQEKGTSLKDCHGILWGPKCPRFACQQDLDALGKFLYDKKIDVCIIDPLYLCLGGRGISTTNLFEVGPLLLNFANACLDVGCTPIIIHHATKGATAKRSKRGDPLDLDDLAYPGIAEFARQWSLVSRREPFVIGSGVHRLWLSVGGSAGHSSIWGVDVDEGVIRDDFSGRKWEVKVIRGDQIAVEKASERRQKRGEEVKRKIVEFLKGTPAGETTKAITTAIGVDKNPVGEAIKELVADGKLVPTKIPKKAGKGKVKHDGWKLAPAPATDGTPTAPNSSASRPAAPAATRAATTNGARTQTQAIPSASPTASASVPQAATAPAPPKRKKKQGKVSQ
jgi:hypothetical protein